MFTKYQQVTKCNEWKGWGEGVYSVLIHWLYPKEEFCSQEWHRSFNLSIQDAKLRPELSIYHNPIILAEKGLSSKHQISKYKWPTDIRFRQDVKVINGDHYALVLFLKKKKKSQPVIHHFLRTHSRIPWSFLLDQDYCSVSAGRGGTPRNPSPLGGRGR